jgi:ABC-type oligopeptide transport system ATPase subunit
MLEVSALRKIYRARVPGGAPVAAVDGVSFTVGVGETLGLVGESGCGKSTLSRCLMRLVEPSDGRVSFDGTDVRALGSGALRLFRRRMQIVHQDPYSSLDPLMRIDRTLAAPLRHVLGLDARATETRMLALLEEVGLNATHRLAYPHELSGGQRQRVAIARALSLNPEFIIADEPTSALDVSIQAQVLNLLLRLQRDHGLAMLFISHDISLVAHMSDQIAVMQAGKFVETGAAQQVIAHPQHPYTRSLLAARPHRPAAGGPQPDPAPPAPLTPQGVNP